MNDGVLISMEKAIELLFLLSFKESGRVSRYSSLCLSLTNDVMYT